MTMTPEQKTFLNDIAAEFALRIFVFDWPEAFLYLLMAIRANTVWLRDSENAIRELVAALQDYGER